MQATGSRSQVAYVTESNWGTTPATPQLTAIPFSSFGINLTKSVYEDDSVQADRMIRHTVHGNRTVSGSVTVNYSASDYDAFLESLCYNSFSTNVLKTGVTQKSFTIEQGSLDIGQYTVYTGCTVTSMTLDVPLNGMCKSTFNVIGKDMSLSATPLDGTVTMPAATQPFYHGTGSFLEGGSAVGIITSLNLTIDNGVQSNFALGNTASISATPGMSTITGTIQVYFENGTLVNKFLNGSDSSIQFTLTDGVKSHTYLLPKVKYNGSTREIAGQQPITMSLPFTAHYDSLNSSNIVITRV